MRGNRLFKNTGGAGGYDSVGTIAGYDSGCLFVVPEPDAEHNLEYVRPYRS